MLISVRMHMKGVEPLINFRSMIEVAIPISSKLMIEVEDLKLLKSTIEVEQPTILE